MRLSYMLTAAAGVAAIAAGVALIHSVRHRASAAVNPHATMAPVPSVAPANSPFSDAHHADYARLTNRLARRTDWTRDDAAWLLGLIAEPWPDAPPPGVDDQAAFETMSLREDAIIVAAERLAWRGPLPDDVADALETAVNAMLTHPQPHVRRRGVYTVFDAGWGKARRDQIARMARTDPSPAVRQAARHKLKQHDGIPDFLTPGPSE